MYTVHTKLIEVTRTIKQIPLMYIIQANNSECQQLTKLKGKMQKQGTGALFAPSGRKLCNI